MSLRTLSNDQAAQRPPHQFLARHDLRRSVPHGAADRCSRELDGDVPTSSTFAPRDGDAIRYRTPVPISATPTFQKSPRSARLLKALRSRFGLAPKPKGKHPTP